MPKSGTSTLGRLRPWPAALAFAQAGTEALGTTIARAAAEDTVRLHVAAARFRPAATDAKEVPRAALLERMQAARSRLLLLHAAAGFGKTRLLAQLWRRMESSNIDLAWITLDSADNDPERLAGSVRAALMAGKAQPCAQSSLQHLLAWFSARTRPLALFLDGGEHIVEPRVLQALGSILDALPPDCRMILASRHRLNLNLPRLRTQGDLLELQEDDLRFSSDETAQLWKACHEREASASVLHQLLAKTEGWVTGLRAAACALEEALLLETDFLPVLRPVEQCFADDVFASLPGFVRHFLLRTSVLNQLEVPLCQALVPHADVVGILHLLETQHVFLQASRGEAAAWSYGRLFREFLRRQLELEHSQEPCRLHLLASAWYEAQDRHVEAIEHAILGTDHPHAVALLETRADALLESGRMRLLGRWFNALPEEALRCRPALQAIAVWAELFSSGPMQASGRLDRLECARDADPQAQAHVNALGPLMLIMRDRYDQAREQGEQRLAALPSANGFADGMLRTAMALLSIVLGDSRRAQVLLDEARRDAPDSRFHRMFSEVVEGLLDLQAGRLRLATARFRAALSASREPGEPNQDGNTWAGLFHAAALYGANELAEAERLVDTLLPQACAVGLPGHILGGFLIRARIAFLRGDVDRSYQALADLESVAHQLRLPRLVANAKLERARLLLLNGDAQGSLEQLERAADADVRGSLEGKCPPGNEINDYALSRARWTLHFGDAASALPWIERELAEVTAQQRLRRAIRLRALYALGLQRAGDPLAAAKEMAVAVRQAAPEGFIRLVVDEGPEVGRIVRLLQQMQQQMPANRTDQAFLRFLDTLLKAFGPLPLEPVSAEVVSSVVETLTRKEIQVLQLVASGHSNAELCQALKASDSTVRTHLRAINTKLGARSRGDAVAIGRRLGIVR